MQAAVCCELPWQFCEICTILSHSGATLVVLTNAIHQLTVLLSVCCPCHSTRVLSSSGQLGVPRVEKPHVTEPKPFNLRSDSRARVRRSHEQPTMQQAAAAHFKAQPLNRSILDGPVRTALGVVLVLHPASSPHVSVHRVPACCKQNKVTAKTCSKPCCCRSAPE